ncbi:MAG: VOC family protein [Alphaproteobacteria bacterium]
MFNHLSFGVTDLERSRIFYDAVLTTLGYRCTKQTKEDVAYGPGSDSLFFLYPASGQKVAGPGTHLAFDAPDEEAVRKFFAAAIDAGGRAVRPPGPRPELGPDYFGTVIDDPDGHRLEVVVAAVTMH